MFVLLSEVLFAVSLSGRTVCLSAPGLVEKTARLYYYTGARVDSLLLNIDSTGRAEFVVPVENYRGMITLVVPEAGGIELVLAEPALELKVESNSIGPETVFFPESKENLFLKHVFTAQAKNMKKQAWLESGKQFYSPGEHVFALIEREEKLVDEAMKQLRAEIDASTLYAAGYYRLSDFLNRLFDAEQTRNGEKAERISGEMETTLNAGDMFRAGRIREMIHNYYISMFNRVNNPEKRRDYVRSVIAVLNRLGQPEHEDYFAGVLHETERFGWAESQKEIIERVLGANPDFRTNIPILNEILGRYRKIENEVAPAVAGLAETTEKYEHTLLVFFDSECGTCVEEMKILIERYAQLRMNSVRIVSIAADTDKQRYKDYARKLPWSDKLCDFKGFEGTNFTAFGVFATPSFFLIDSEGKITGRYFDVDEITKVVIR
jgi:thiol-disulfide isomerase/thioredoxin